MSSIPVRSARNGYVLITLLLLAVIAAPLLIPGTTETVFARKYGGYKKNYGAIYAKYIARCKAGCGRTNGAIAGCIKRDGKLQASNCRQAFNADRGLVADAKSRLKLCMQGIGAGMRHDRKAITGHYGVKRCSGCCQRTRGEGNCLSYFSSSRFYGSYRYHGHLTCNGSSGSSDGTTGGCDQQCQCGQQCKLVAERARLACGGGKKADPACLQQVAAAMQACLAQCGTPASQSGASARIRSQVASWLPWVVRGWND